MHVTGLEDRSSPLGRSRLKDSIFSVVPEDTGPRIAAFRGGAAHVIRPPGSQKIQKTDHNLVSIMLAPTENIKSALGSDKLQEYNAGTGAIIITPAGVDAQVSWQHTRENVTVILPPESLMELAEQEFGSAGRELQPAPLGTIDPWALQIALLLKTELTRTERVNELYIDSLITILGVHLLRTYTGKQKPVEATPGEMSARRAQRVLDYLEANFTRKLSVAELASVAGLSPHYFIQVFARTFGKPPHQYVIDMRLRTAEKLLVTSDLTITEVAYMSGFSNQSHLTTTMKKMRNMTPMQVRQGK